MRYRMSALHESESGRTVVWSDKVREMDSLSLTVGLNDVPQ